MMTFKKLDSLPATGANSNLTGARITFCRLGLGFFVGFFFFEGLTFSVLLFSATSSLRTNQPSVYATQSDKLWFYFEMHSDAYFAI